MAGKLNTQIHPDPTPEEAARLEFYCTVMSDTQTAALLGPYPTQEEAKENLGRGKQLANDADPWAAFYAFGTASAVKGTSLKTVFGN